jgi:hypothetical protein
LYIQEKIHFPSETPPLPPKKRKRKKEEKLEVPSATIN